MSVGLRCKGAPKPAGLRYHRCTHECDVYILVCVKSAVAYEQTKRFRPSCFCLDAISPGKNCHTANCTAHCLCRGRKQLAQSAAASTHCASLSNTCKSSMSVRRQPNPASFLVSTGSGSIPFRSRNYMSRTHSADQERFRTGMQRLAASCMESQHP